MASKPAQSKHARIRQTLADQIANGRYDAGQRLPSESELVKAFGVSRPTVNRALRELQLTGLIDRRAGSGSYVRADAGAHGYVFGLLMRISSERLRASRCRCRAISASSAWTT